MDLALALALLWKTEQIDISVFNTKKIYAYGEVSLNGNIQAPSDWDLLPFDESPLVTGPIKKTNYRKNLYMGANLKELPQAQLLKVSDWKKCLKKPDRPRYIFL